MKMPLFPRTWRVGLRLVLALAVVWLIDGRAAAQNCFFGCTPIYATQDTVHGISCFSLSSGSCSSSNPLTVHVSFGLSVEFFQPNPPPQSFGAHTATSGICTPGCTGDNFFDTGVFTDNANPSSNYVTFDGHSTAGGNLNAGTYNYFCAPHGAGMRGVIIVDPDGTSTSVSQTVGTNPSTYGQSITFTATVSNSVFFSGITPTGFVRFQDNGVFISGFLALNGSGQATFTSSTFTGGAHSITAFYTHSGVNFADSDSSGSPLAHTVNAANTATSITNATPNPATVGQTVSFAAHVSNNSGTGPVPTGTATFQDNGSPISGAIALDGSGNAAFNTSALPGGTNPITVVYTPANSNFNGSSSAITNEDVRDFSLSISNPVQSVLPNQTATFNGTVSSLSGYAGTITVVCGAGAPATCNGASVPLAANAQNVPFTVTASNNAVANFSFSISGTGTGLPFARSVPVTLSVGSFSFSQPTPSSLSVAQGNPSSTMTFQVSSLGTFSGEVDLSCPAAPSGVTCMFSNGAATQALVLSPGQVINDTLVLITSSGAVSGSITVQATPVAAPGQFQTRTVVLTETAPTHGNAYLYFGNSPNGFTQNPTKLPALVAVGGRFSFDISAYNSDAVPFNSQNVNMTLIFVEPISNASETFTWATGGESCTLVSPIEISCSLGTITAAAPYIKTVTFNVTAATGRTLDFNAILSESNVNLGSPTVLPGSVKLRYRPMVRPGQMPGNNNPK